MIPFEEMQQNDPQCTLELVVLLAAHVIELLGNVGNIGLRNAPGAQHELVRVHPETGRKCLFLGRRRNSCILGLPLAESEALLDELWEHATRAEFTFRQQWRVGDVLIWDNRCTLHRRDPFDPNARRLMHRTQIKADRLRA